MVYSVSKKSNMTKGRMMLKKSEALPGRMMYIMGRWMIIWRLLIMPTMYSIEPTPAMTKFRIREKKNVICKMRSVDCDAASKF